MPIQAHRGEILHCLANPAVEGDKAIRYYDDGVLLIEGGYVAQIGSANALIDSLPEDCEIIHHHHGLIIPGMVDCHVHYPQCDVIAAYGTQLLEWLEKHTFPLEQQFSDPEIATQTASFFLDQLLSNGTTTALVFGTVHPQSVDSFFTEAHERNLRIICGKVMMDRNAPPALCDTAEQSYVDSKSLIRKWHNKNRLGYAVTPRFAPTSTDNQLAMASKLLQEFPDVHFHTHTSENLKEVEWVSELFPDSKNYIDVYDRHQLLGRRSVFAHSIHLAEAEWQRLSDSKSGIAHCPTSNLFIGSGLFDYHTALQRNINVGLGTDVGGGDSFSLLRTINEAYKIQQLRENNLSPYQAFYLATLGGATTLDLDSKIGNFEPGKEADFVVLDYQATALIDRRISSCKNLEEKLFVLEMLGDDRAILETYIMGVKYDRRQSTRSIL